MPAVLFFILAVISRQGITGNGNLSFLSGSVQHNTPSDYAAETISSVQKVTLANMAIVKSTSVKIIAARRFNNKTAFTEQSKLKYSYSQFNFSYTGNAGSSRTDNSFLKFLRITKMLC